MCVFVYIGSDHELPIIPWDEQAPDFHVQDMTGDAYEERVRKQLKQEHIYLAGTSEGCGCRFSYGEYPKELVEEEDEALGRRSVTRLRDYLVRAVAEGPVELYAVWADDEGIEPERRFEVRPCHFGGDSFFFRTPELFLVSSDRGGC